MLPADLVERLAHARRHRREALALREHHISRSSHPLVVLLRIAGPNLVIRQPFKRAKVDLAQTLVNGRSRRVARSQSRAFDSAATGTAVDGRQAVVVQEPPRLPHLLASPMRQAMIEPSIAAAMDRLVGLAVPQQDEPRRSIAPG